MQCVEYPVLLVPVRGRRVRLVLFASATTKLSYPLARMPRRLLRSKKYVTMLRDAYRPMKSAQNEIPACLPIIMIGNVCVYLWFYVPQLWQGRAGKK